jgi:hypothetical protein
VNVVVTIPHNELTHPWPTNVGHGVSDEGVNTASVDHWERPDDTHGRWSSKAVTSRNAILSVFMYYSGVVG